MKTQKLLFNHLLRRYNKSVRRVARLIESGKNLRRQGILQRHIEKLYSQLMSLQINLKRGAIVASAVVATVAFDAQAQDFAAPQSDPFGLSFPGVYLSNATFADLDNDGDMDMLSGEFGYYSGSANFLYYENTGSSSNPDFSTLVSNPFGMSSGGDNLTRPTFVDIDGDGDMDIVSGTYYGEFLFLENVGTSSAPSFAAPVESPFGFETVDNFACPTFADIDGDGDYDLFAGSNAYYTSGFSYQENTGSASAPAFGPAQSTPFSIQSAGNVLTAGFADVDMDGDLDLLTGGIIYSSYGNFAYYENIGNSTSPDFGLYQINPFNIQPTGEGWTTVGFADLNNDGLLDFMSGSTYGEFFFYEQNCDVQANALPACGGADGTVNANATTPTGTDTYVWSNGATTPMISGLSAGTYIVTVTSSTGCVVSDTATVEGLNSSGLFVVAGAQDISCNGDGNGAVNAYVANGNSPYSYEWSNGSSQLYQNQLGAGIYDITVTDGCGASMVSTDTINEPSALSITMSSTDESGAGNWDGEAVATVTGGTSPYIGYYWNNGGSNSETNSGLNGGIYTVNVEDGNGCQVFGSVTVSTVGCNLAVTASVVDPDFCGDWDGSAVASATGGTAPYTFNWDNGWWGVDTTYNLHVGDVYVVTAYDDLGCSGFASVTMTGGEGIANVQITAIDPTCGSNNGGASVAVTGGTSPLSYTWFDFNQNLLGTGTSLTNLPVGVIGVEVEDANGCYDEDYELLSNPGAPSFNVDVIDVTCPGDMDGSITINASGGTSPYVYTWMNADNGVITTGISSMTGLAGGTDFLLTISDAASPSCSATGYASVEGGDSIYFDVWVTEPYCNGESTGDINLNVWGGTWPIDIEWSNDSTGNYIYDLSAGNYDVTLTDDNGCTMESSVLLNEPDPIQVNVASYDATCGNIDGSADVSTPMGVMNYNWSDGQTASTAINLGAGIYDVTIQDFNGCTSQATSFAIANSDGPSITTNATDVICNGDADGSITVVSAGTSYTYDWSNGPTTADQSGLSGGTYTLTVSDAGCDSYASVDIIENDAVIVSASATDESSAGADDGAALAIASGGDGNLSFDWGAAGSNDYVSGLAAGSYTVTVTDGNGCDANATVVVNGGAAVTCTLSATGVSLDATTNGGSDGTAGVNVSNEQGNLTYLWSNGSTSSSLAGLTAGSYSVTVTDDIQAGCTATATAVVGEPLSIGEVNNSIELSLYPNPNNGTFVVSISKEGNYNVAVRNVIGQTVESVALNGTTKEISLNNIDAGIYFVTIKSEGYEKTEKIIVR